ncbi:MAG: hypothetical protein CMM50_06555 [Rhodospirillaceae bacterium]|nr:hypothetical protein [Rhodospirillaceae bacterium]
MAFDPLALPRVAVLGDSRVFDSYYTNPAYGAARYGYHLTFPHRLRGSLLSHPQPVADVVHIPDHFRGATVENNILRLALVDPWMVVLVDGIWESLLDKRHFLDYVRRRIEDFDWRDGKSLDLSFSSRRLVDLFKAGELGVSPDDYAQKQRGLISHFVRRRRAVVWATIPVTPPDHLSRKHAAGDYLVIPEWGEVLAALNEATAAEANAWGATVLDLDALMRAQGGPSACLLDQWHFTPAFHAAIAEALEAMIVRTAPAADAALAGPIMPGDRPEGPVAVAGSETDRAAFRQANPDIAIGHEMTPDDDGPVEEKTVILLLPAGDERDGMAQRWLRATAPDVAVLYPEELGPLANPVGRERAEHGTLHQAVREAR